MADRQYHSTSSLTESTTASATPQDKCTLTFTPDASSNYLLVFSCLVASSDASGDPDVRLYNSTDAVTLYELQTYGVQDTTDYWQVQGISVFVSGGSPVSTTFKLQYSSQSTGTTAIKEARLTAIKLSATDVVGSPPDDSAATTSATYTVQAACTFTPSGTKDYLVLASGVKSSSVNTLNGNFRLSVDGSAVITEQQAIIQTVTEGNSPFFFVYKAAGLTAVSHTIQLEVNRVTTGTVYSSWMNCVCLDLTGFDDSFYAQALTRATVATTIYGDVVTTTPTVTAGDWFIAGHLGLDHDETTSSVLSKFVVDGSTAGGESTQEPVNATSSSLMHAGYAGVHTLTAGSKTFNAQIKSESGTRVSGATNSAIAGIRLEAASGTAYSLTASAGSFALTGVAATLTYSSGATAYSLTASAGSFALTGIAASLSYAEPPVATGDGDGVSIAYGNAYGSVYAGNEDPYPENALLVLAPLIDYGINDAVVLLEITTGNDTGGAPQDLSLYGGIYAEDQEYTVSSDATLYFSDADWTETQSATETITMQNTYFAGRLRQADISHAMTLRPGGGSKVAVSIGQLALANQDGELDYVTQRFGVDSQPVTLRLLPRRHYRYSDSVKLVSSLGRRWTAGRETLTLDLADPTYYLDIPMLDTYAGTGGMEGTENVKDMPKPQAYGLVRNITPVLVDPALLIYQVHDSSILSFDGIYVRGAPVTHVGGDALGSYGDLETASVASGYYQASIAAEGSFFKLGSSPDGTVTADIHGDYQGGYEDDAPFIMKSILVRADVMAYVNAADFDELSSSLPAVCGIYFDSQLTYRAALDAVAAGSFLQWGDLGNGLISVVRIAPPSIAATALFDDSNLRGDPEPADLPDSFNPCLYRVSVTWKKNWTPLNSVDVVPEPTITEERRQELIQPYKQAISSDTNRRIKNPGAVDAGIIETIFDEEADAIALGNNLLSLFSQGRRLLQVPAGLSSMGLLLGRDTVKVQHPRFGLSDGVNFRVIGREMSDRSVTLTVFG